MLLTKFATMIGQMIALIGPAILFYAENTGRGSWFDAAAGAAACCGAGDGCLARSFALPLSSRHSQKLHTFLMLKENYETNIPLQRQLEDTPGKSAAGTTASKC